MDLSHVKTLGGFVCFLILILKLEFMARVSGVPENVLLFCCCFSWKDIPFVLL